MDALDDDYRVAQARFTLWSATKSGNHDDICQATSALNQLLAEELQ